MDDERKHRFPFTTIALTLLAVFALYMGAYYALVVPLSAMTSPIVKGVALTSRVPEYRYGGEIIRQIFRPAHAIDRMLRPDKWPGRRK
jgi:hypothetical protein